MTGVRLTPIVTSVLLLVLLRAEHAEAKSPQLPDSFPTCSKSDKKLAECILEKGRQVLPLLMKGNPELRVPSLDPMFVPEVIVEQTGSGQAVGITLINRNITVRGLKDITMDKHENEVTATSARFTTWLTIPRLEIISKYEVKGRILILPIEGKGDSNLTLVGNKASYKFDNRLEEKDGELYMVPYNDDLSINTTRAYFHLTNLFNGDKALGDNMNTFLNENWQDVMQEIGPDILVAVKKVVHNLNYNFVGTYSFNAIFPEK